MEIIRRQLSDLIPYENNTKKHPANQIANLAESIRRFGFRNPVLIDKNGEIVCGHGRCLAAKKAGLTEVPCILVEDLSPEDVKAYRILDNKLNESPWDEKLLSLELPKIDISGFDLNFDVPEIDTDGHFWGEDMPDEESEEYQDFVEKFKPKATTDDCYTPPNVYETARDWAIEHYGLEGAQIIRPFYPGGDYQKENYPDGCVIIDNPPFSILTEICRWYDSQGIRFFLFAQGLSLFSLNSGKENYIVCGVAVTYENGANVNTSFVTNMGEYKIETAPDLYEAIHTVNLENLRKAHKHQVIYEYPDAVCNARMNLLAKYGQTLKIPANRCRFIRALEAQKEADKAIYGGGFLLSEKAAAEKAAAEKAAAEKAAAEKAAAEKAAAEKWELSEAEKAIMKELDND